MELNECKFPDAKVSILAVEVPVDEWARIMRESEERKAALAKLESEVYDLRAKHTAALAQFLNDVRLLIEKNALQRQAIDRSVKEQVQLARALRALVDVLVSEKYAHVQRQFGGEFFRALTDCIEVLKLIEPPF